MQQSKDSKLRVEYFSDILCIWAYLAQIKLDELKKNCGVRVELSYHFVPIFGDVQTRVVAGWADRGGPAAYGRHVLEVAKAFPHVMVHPDIWQGELPASSCGVHLMLKSAQLLEKDGVLRCEPVAEFGGRTLFEELMWQFRLAFFRDGRNIASQQIQLEVAAALGIDSGALLQGIENGRAHAALCRDNELLKEYSVQGSPTFLLNEGRQKLYGNIGYRVIEANVMELLEHPADRASWC